MASLSKTARSKLLVLHFPSLLNYGTGMMGVNTLFHLSRLKAGVGEVHVVLDQADYLEEIREELGGDSGFRMVRLPSNPEEMRGRGARMKRWFRHAAGAAWARVFGSDALRPLPCFGHLAPFSQYKAIIVLGGDDLSEYYVPGKRLTLLRTLKAMADRSQLVLLGQSPGPFTLQENVGAMAGLGAAHFFVREPSAQVYLKDVCGLSERVKVCGDLAFLPLPRQNEAGLAGEVLQRFGLESGGYETLVLSGDAAYYDADEDVFLERWCEIAQWMARRAAKYGRRLCLLVHTFPPYGDEASLVEEVYRRLPDELHSFVVKVSEKVGPTRARLILGNGRLTVTGRMHPSVSTFQMGKPAVPLSYSRKYNGVIGEGLGRQDLVVDARGRDLWSSGRVVELVAEKVEYVDARYDALLDEIPRAVARQAALAGEALEDIAGMLREVG